MKKGLFYVGMMVVAMGLATSTVNAQFYDTDEVICSLPAMANLAVVGEVTPSLTFPVTPPGFPIPGISSYGNYINYTSVVDGLASNRVTVHIADGTVPAGTSLIVEASFKAPFDGDGLFGVPMGGVLLSPIPQDLIVGIGSCYTGGFIGSGHQLNYTWLINNYYELRATTAPVSITLGYTITSNIN